MSCGIEPRTPWVILVYCHRLLLIIMPCLLCEDVGPVRKRQKHMQWRYFQNFSRQQHSAFSTWTKYKQQKEPSGQQHKQSRQTNCTFSTTSLGVIYLSQFTSWHAVASLWQLTFDYGVYGLLIVIRNTYS